MDPQEHEDEPEFEDLSDLEADEEFEEIDDAEREALHQDLVDVRTLKLVLGSRGIRGIVVFCTDCDADHFLGWDLLAGNLQQILESGRPPVHEPAWEPDPDEYVTWDYARGFLDGVELSPVEDGSEMCAFCHATLPSGGYDWNFCPSCGKELAIVNLVNLLLKEGWKDDKIMSLLEECGFEAPLMLPSDLQKLRTIELDPPDPSEPPTSQPPENG